MATNKFKELQSFTDIDLNAELLQIREQYQKMTFEHAINGLEKPILLREVRRDIARLQTEIRRRELINLPKDQLKSRSKIRNRRRK